MADTTINQLPLANISQINGALTCIPISNGITTNRFPISAVNPNIYGPNSYEITEKNLRGYKGLNNNTSFDLFYVSSGDSIGYGTLDLDLYFFHAGGGRHGIYTRKRCILNAYSEIILMENYESVFDQYTTSGTTLNASISVTRPSNNIIKFIWIGSSMTFANDYDLTGKIRLFNPLGSNSTVVIASSSLDFLTVY